MRVRNKIFKSFGVAVVCALVGAETGGAAEPLVKLSFDKGTIENTGSFELSGLAFSDAEGDSPVFVDTGIYGIQAIKLDGTNYVTTTTATSALGISGAASKTVSAVVKPDATGNYALWTVGSTTNASDFTIKISGDKTLMGQLWSYDFDTTTPYSIKDWGVVTESYDGKTVSIYYNGQLVGSSDVALNTGNNTIKVGYWNHLNNSLRGAIADFRIYGESFTAEQARRQAYDLGGGLFSFNDYVSDGFGVDTNDGWYASCGNRMFKTLSYGGMDAISSYTKSNQVVGVDGTGDNAMGILWGQPFTVADDTKEITFKMAGGSFTAPDAETESGTNLSALRGKAGMILYDITEGKFLLDTYRCSDTNEAESNFTKTISLKGLKGHEVALALVDLQTDSWGMTAVGDINIPLGAGYFNQVGPSLITETKSFSFDTVGDWEGWFEVDANGVRLDSVKNFRFGAPGDCLYSIGSNFITSNSPSGGWDAASGTLRSETFTLDGDIVEFMINGGANGDYAFELWIKPEDSDEFELAREARRETNGNDFQYSLWDVSALEGLEAYFQLRDNQKADWGWIGVDNIRIVDFGQVPEPSTWALLLLGTSGIFVCRRRRG